MKYVLLIYSDESMAANMPPEMMTAFMGEYEAYTRDIMAAGVRLAGEALQPTATATTVQNQEGNVVTTHGPFAETKEQLGGFYLIEAENLDEAIAWAGKCPEARFGKIEIRPVMSYDITE
ncbi:MAG: YciI family protein [Chloroflexota bacterium]